MNPEENQPLKKKKKVLSEKIIFLLILLIFSFCIVWIFLDYWQDIQGGNKNFVHESVGLFFSFGAMIGSYFGIYRQQDSFINAKKKKKKKTRDETNEKARIKLVSAIEHLKNGSTNEKETSIQTLLEIGTTVPDQRQICVNALAGLNHWMLEYKNLLLKENLILWRLNHKPFKELSIPKEKQELSLQAIISIEKIIKQHIIDFETKKTKTSLDLSTKCIPALNLGFVKFPQNCILFNFGFFWEISFWESILNEIDFSSAELQKSNFWKSKLINVNFENTKLTNAKLKTDLTNTKNLTSFQLFSTIDWTYNNLSQEQIDTFFPEKNFKNESWEKWSLGSIERKKMFKATL